MPKVSKSTAAHVQIPELMESFTGENGGWSVSFDAYSADIDGAPLFKGAPDDLCPATHVGYVLKGRFGIRTPDGTEEVFEAGDAFVVGPGHIPYYYAGLEMVAFTPAEEANLEMAYMMPNITRLLEEQGLEMPAQFQTQT